MNEPTDPRQNQQNYTFPDDQLVEAKVQLAIQGYRNNKFNSIKAAADFYEAPYRRTMNRLRGHYPVSKNGGRCTVLDEAGDKALHAAMQRLVLQGSRVSSRHVEAAANDILKQICEPGKTPRQVNRRWARRYLEKHRHLSKRTRAEWAKLPLNNPNPANNPTKPPEPARPRRNSI